MNLCNLGELQMEDKEKKQMLTTELTKEKGGGIVGIIQDITINGIKLHLAQNGTGRHQTLLISGTDSQQS